MRRQVIPVGIAIGVGLIVLVHQFVTNSYLDLIAGVLIAWAALVAAFAVLLGLFNVLSVHLQRAARRQGNAWTSIVVLVTATVVLVATLPSGGASPLSNWALRYLYQPLEASFLALVVFFVATAAVRVLRAGTIDSALLVASSLLVLIGAVPISNLISPYLPAARDWVLNVPTVAGVRGILLGVSLGVIATSVRLLTGIDRPYSE